MGRGLEPADKILISGTFCWHREHSSTARTKRKATLSEIGHTVCFGLHSLHLFAITIPFCSRKKLFLERVILLLLLLGSPEALLGRQQQSLRFGDELTAAGRGGTASKTQLRTCNMVTCSFSLVRLELWGVLFYFLVFFFLSLFLRCSRTERS